MRLTMVVREERRAQAQAAAATLGQGEPFNPELQVIGDTTRTVVARWCSWVMTDDESNAIRQAFRGAGFKNNEVTLLGPDTTTDLADVLFVFDGDQVHRTVVLDKLGLEPVPGIE